MKKWLLGLLTAMMAVSLAACTPTTEKKQETTTTAAAAKQEQIAVFGRSTPSTKKQ